MESDKGQIENIENVQAPVNWRKAAVVVLAMNVMAYAQIIAVVGSGLLARQTTEYLGDPPVAAWLSTILTIVGLALNPILSQAADFWGRRWIIIITSLGGFVGPLVISRADNIDTLLAGFSLLGLAMGCQALFYTVVSEVLPRRHRSNAQAFLNISIALGSISGVMIGGALLRGGDNSRFRVFWYIVAGLYFLGIAGVLFCYNPPRRQQSSLSFREKLAALDLVGGLLLSAGLTTFCVGLQWSDNPYTWRDAHVVAPFVVGVVLTILFAVYEWRLKVGILHHRLFGSRNFVIALMVIFVEGMAYFTTNSYYAMEVQLLTQTDLFQAGLRFSIIFFTTAGFAAVVGLYTMWTRQLREPLIFGFVCFTIWNAVMASVTADTFTSSPNVFWGYPVLCGMGLGCILVNLTVITQMSTPRELISLATGVLTATRSLGATVGLAINTAIFNKGLNLQSRLAAAVLPLGFPAENLGLLLQALSTGDPLAAMQVPGADLNIIGAAGVAMQKGYLNGFRNVWICGAAFSAAALVVTCFLHNVKSEFTHEIDAPVDDNLTVFNVTADAHHLARSGAQA